MTQFNDPRVFRVNPGGQAFRAAPEGQSPRGQEWTEEPVFRPMPTEADVPIEVMDLEGVRMHAAFAREIAVTESGWFTLQAVADGRVHPIESRRPMATTNPVYVYVAGRPIRNRQSADYFVRWIDRLTEMAAEHPGWRSDREREHVLQQFLQARAVYVQRGREATGG